MNKINLNTQETRDYLDNGIENAEAVMTCLETGGMHPMAASCAIKGTLAYRMSVGMSEGECPAIDGAQLQAAIAPLDGAAFPDLNALLSISTYLDWREEYTYSVEHNFHGQAPVGIDTNTGEVMAETVKLFDIDLPEDGDYPDLQAHVMDMKDFVLQDLQDPQHSHTIYEEAAAKARTVLRTALYYLREVGLEDLYNWTGNDYPLSQDYRDYGMTGYPYQCCQALLAYDGHAHLTELLGLLGYATFREVLEEVRIMQKHSVRFGLIG